MNEVRVLDIVDRQANLKNMVTLKNFLNREEAHTACFLKPEHVVEEKDSKLLVDVLKNREVI